ncbi:MAG: M48 family metalloprotease, partial [Halobacteriota archaeon]
MQWKTDWGLRLRMGVTMFLLFALYLVFAAFIVWYMGGGMAMFVLLMGSFSIAQWYFSDKLTLWSMGAKEVTEAEYPDLHRSIRRLSQQADLPMPKVAVVDSKMPNAFATGRSKNHAAVAVTTGILQTLDREELEGVLAHELSHIKNRDMAVMTVASFLSTVAFIVVRWGWLFGGRNRQQGGAPVIVAILASLV